MTVLDKNQVLEHQRRERLVFFAAGALAEMRYALQLFANRGPVPSQGLRRTYEAAGQVYAKAFVLALDNIRAAIAALEPSFDGFGAAFPGLHNLRNSIAHSDERLERRAWKKTITPAEVNTGSVRGGAMIIGTVIDGSYTSTGEDGHRDALPLSEATVGQATALLHEVVARMPNAAQMLLLLDASW